MFKSTLSKLTFISLFIVNGNFANAHVTPIVNNTSEDKPRQKFIRIEKDDNTPVAMQTAIVRYVPEDGIPNDLHVDLISAVHIGDQAYYEKLNILFKKYDVVLYESVSKKKPKNLKSNRNAARSISSKRNKSFISSIQTTMAESLGLSFQMHGIDYTASNFVHADLSPDEFFKSMEKNGESYASWTINSLLIGLQQYVTNPGKNAELNMGFLMAMISPNKDKDLKIFAANLLENEFAKDSLRAFEGKNGSTIITARNDRVLQVLREEIEKGNKSVAIFYGGGHYPEMEEVLINEFKLKPDQVTWIDAWDLR